MAAGDVGDEADSALSHVEDMEGEHAFSKLFAFLVRIVCLLGLTAALDKFAAPKIRTYFLNRSLTVTSSTSSESSPTAARTSRPTESNEHPIIIISTYFTTRLRATSAHNKIHVT